MKKQQRITPVKVEKTDMFYKVGNIIGTSHWMAPLHTLVSGTVKLDTTLRDLVMAGKDFIRQHDGTMIFDAHDRFERISKMYADMFNRDDYPVYVSRATYDNDDTILNIVKGNNMLHFVDNRYKAFFNYAGYTGRGCGNNAFTFGDFVVMPCRDEHDIMKEEVVTIAAA